MLQLDNTTKEDRMMFYPKRVSPGLCAKTSIALLTFVLSATYISGQTVEPLPLKEEADPKTIPLEYIAAPIDKILNLYSELTGRTTIKDPKLNAIITVRTKGLRFTPKEAIAALESVFAVNNIDIVPLADKFLKVVNR